MPSASLSQSMQHWFALYALTFAAGCMPVPRMTAMAAHPCVSMERVTCRTSWRMRFAVTRASSVGSDFPRKTKPSKRDRFTRTSTAFAAQPTTSSTRASCGGMAIPRSFMGFFIS